MLETINKIFKSPEKNKFDDEKNQTKQSIHDILDDNIQVEKIDIPNNLIGKELLETVEKKENKIDLNIDNIDSTSDKLKYYFVQDLYKNTFAINVLISGSVAVFSCEIFINLIKNYNNNLTIIVFTQIILLLPIYYFIFKKLSKIIRKINTSNYENFLTDLSKGGKVCEIHIEIDYKNLKIKGNLNNLTPLTEEIKQKKGKYKNVQEIILSSYLFGKKNKLHEPIISQIGDKVKNLLNIKNENIKEVGKLSFIKKLNLFCIFLFKKEKLFSINNIKESYKRTIDIYKKGIVYEFKINVDDK